MAKKKYDLTAVSILQQFGASPTASKNLYRDIATGRFIGAQGLSERIANQGWNPSAARWQATHAVGGRRPFMKGDLVMKVISYLEQKQPVDDWDLVGDSLDGGKFTKFQLNIPSGFAGELSHAASTYDRFFLIMRSTTVLSKICNLELENYVESSLDELRQTITSILKSRVYNKQVMVRRLTDDGYTRSKVRPRQYRTYNLLRAFTTGISIDSAKSSSGELGVSYGINEAMAPYWLWVEKGHEVANKYGRTGTFVEGRPFVKEVFYAVEKFFDAKLREFYNDDMIKLTKSLGSWVVGKDVDLSEKFIKNWPSGGYDNFLSKWGL